MSETLPGEEQQEGKGGPQHSEWVALWRFLISLTTLLCTVPAHTYHLNSEPQAVILRLSCALPSSRDVSLEISCSLCFSVLLFKMLRGKLQDRHTLLIPKVELLWKKKQMNLGSGLNTWKDVFPQQLFYCRLLEKVWFFRDRSREDKSSKSEDVLLGPWE